MVATRKTQRVGGAHALRIRALSSRLDGLVKDRFFRLAWMLFVPENQQFNPGRPRAPSTSRRPATSRPRMQRQLRRDALEEPERCMRDDGAGPREVASRRI